MTFVVGDAGKLGFWEGGFGGGVDGFDDAADLDKSVTGGGGGGGGAVFSGPVERRRNKVAWSNCDAM